MRPSLNLNFPALNNFHRPQQGLTTKPTLKGIIGHSAVESCLPSFRGIVSFYSIKSSFVNPSSFTQTSECCFQNSPVRQSSELFDDKDSWKISSTLTLHEIFVSFVCWRMQNSPPVDDNAGRANEAAHVSCPPKNKCLKRGDRFDKVYKFCSKHLKKHLFKKF